MFWLFGPNKLKPCFDGFLQHLPLKGQNGAESLILGGCRHFSIYSQVGQKCFHLGPGHILRVFFIMEKNV